MISKFGNKELGEKFIEMGNKFLIYAQENKTLLNFEELYIDKDPVCGTVACHGGHACVIFGLGGLLDFTDGAIAIAEFLGFANCEDYKLWARKNIESWGNIYGHIMFGLRGYRAFGFSKPGKCTLVDIGNHYINVGNRILKSLEN